MSKDQMQDVFPIVFDFKKGEAPTAEKLTGLVKQLDTGLSKATQAIGDPWDQQLSDLSLENLGQSNLARIVGPTDYLSPPSGSWNESSSFDILLYSGKNQWNLGFPLVKTNGIIKEDSAIGILTPLDWGTDITFVSSPDVLTDIKASLSEVVADGDFHVDFYTGTITSFKPATNNITITLNNLASCGAGVPWATHNVIPTWEETTVLCNVSGGGTSYTLTLPVVKKSTRANFVELKGGIKSRNSYDVFINSIVIGENSSYRLPQALIDNYSSGDTIPEGYILLWDNNAERVVPSVQFKYLDEHSLTLVTPTGWLTASTDRYRILISGSSVAEAVNYLMSTTRDNRHVGLVDGALTRKTLFYSAPISHDTLTDLYSSTTNDARQKYTVSTYSTNCHPQYLHRYGFMSNDVVGNHANAMMGDLVFTNWSAYDYAVDAGTLSPTDIGNVFGIRFGGKRTAPDNYASIDWAGGQAVDDWVSGAAKKIGFGLNDLGCKNSLTDEDTGTLVYTPRYDGPLYLRGRSASDLSGVVLEYTGGALGFDLARNHELNYVKLFPAERTGIEVANQPAKISQTDFGSALSITPVLSNRLCIEQLREFRFRGGPYLPNALNKGLGETSTIGETGWGIEYDVYMFKVIADYPYINYKGIILDESYGDVTELFTNGESIKISNSFSNNGEWVITGTYYGRGISDSIERTCVHVTGLTLENPTTGKAQSQIKEFDKYFTSPGVVGADFLNLYSNAIFFSDTGDGRRTSLRDRGKDWLDSNESVISSLSPSGLYYIPGADATNPRLVFSAYQSNLGFFGESKQPFAVGYNWGLFYKGVGPVDLVSDNQSVYISTSYIVAAYPFVKGSYLYAVPTEVGLGSETGTVNINTYASYKSISMQTFGENSNINLYAQYTGSKINLTSSSDISIESTAGDINLETSAPAKYINITTTATGAIFLNSDSIYLPTTIPSVASAAYFVLLIDNVNGEIHKKSLGDFELVP